MADLQLTVRAEDRVIETSSVIQVYVNGGLQAELMEGSRTYSQRISIPDDTAQIELVRRYYYDIYDDPEEKLGPVRKVLSGAIGFVVNAFLAANSPIEPFRCAYEAKESFLVTDIRSGAAIHCTCGFDEMKTYPQFAARSDNCSICTTKKAYMLSDKEIHTQYRERKRFIHLVAIISGLLFLALLLAGIVLGNNVTALFSGVILGIIACCCMISLKHLHKVYHERLDQMKKAVGDAS